MSKVELNQLYFLNKETARLQKDLAELRQKNVSISANLSGMPKGNNKQDKIGDYVSEIMILEETIKLNLQKIFYERNRLERYIADIPDSETRLIMRLRHINGMTWEDIADEIGYNGRDKESTVRKKHKRYLAKVSEISD